MILAGSTRQSYSPNSTVISCYYHAMLALVNFHVCCLPQMWLPFMKLPLWNQTLNLCHAEVEISTTSILMFLTSIYINSLNQALYAKHMNSLNRALSDKHVNSLNPALSDKHVNSLNQALSDRHMNSPNQALVYSVTSNTAFEQALQHQ